MVPLDVQSTTTHDTGPPIPQTRLQIDQQQIRQPQINEIVMREHRLKCSDNDVDSVQRKLAEGTDNNQRVMLSLHCPRPFWEHSHVAVCVQHEYLNTAVPLVAISVSATMLLAHFLRSWRSATNGHFIQLATAERDGGAEEAERQNQYPYSTEEHANPSERPHYIKSHRASAAFLELLALLADLAIYAALSAHQSQSPSSVLSFGAGTISSAYMLLLVAARIIAGRRRPQNYVHLWRHTVSLYLLQWLLGLIVSHAALLDPPSVSDQYFIYTHTALFSCLVLYIATAPTRWVDPVIDSDTKPSDELGASQLSRLTFHWVGRLVWEGYRKPLEFEDLSDLTRELKSASVISSFRAIAGVSPPLLWRIFSYVKRELLWQGVWAASTSLTIFLPPVLLRQILEYLVDPQSASNVKAWLCVFGLLATGVMTAVTDCQCDWMAQKISTRLSAVLIGEIYTKLLRRKAGVGQADGGATDNDWGYVSDGNILNLMSVDVANISDTTGYLHYLWISVPLQVGIATYMLYEILGLSGIAGVVLMIALLPLNVALGKLQGKAQAKVLAATDARIQATNELMTNIRLVKYCGWEHGMRERICRLRQTELKKLTTRFICWSMSMTLWYSIPFLITIAVLFCYTIIAGHELKTTVAFPALAVFAILRMPLDRVSGTIIFVLQAHVSVLRIDKFLAEKETGKYIQLQHSNTTSARIGFENATLMWPSKSRSGLMDQGLQSAINSDERFRLDNLDISFKLEKLNVLYGPSGAGKSSLLLGLLGELELVQGSVFLLHGMSRDVDYSETDSDVQKSTAYCPQEPWILNQSIRENITLRSPFESQRYADVLRACALDRDLSSLDGGDQTIAGENGARLSGGQKQRVALARALYSRARIVLLDDCLSAVDARTANHIFFNGILGTLMSRRTCVLATHNTQLALRHCEHAVCLENGRVKGQGTVEDLISLGLIDRQYSRTKVGPSSGVESPDDLPHSSSASILQEQEATATEPFDDNAELRFKEKKQTGAMGWAVFKSYLVHMGKTPFWVAVIAAFASQQLGALSTNVWVKVWTQRYDEDQAGGPVNPEHGVDATYFLVIYASLCLTFVVVTFVRDAVTFWGTLKASEKIHDRLISSVIHAKMKFFDRTPLGQITNRFSKDIEAVDVELSPFSISMLYLITSIAAVVGLIAFVLPIFLFAATFIGLLYYAIAAIYIRSSRDLKRIASVERSPLYQQFGETISGYISIRAYNYTTRFTAQSHQLTDRYNSPNLALSASKQWLTFRINCISSLISYLAGAFVLWNLGSVNPGAAGLVLTYAATFTENVYFIVQVYTLVEQNLTSVERINEYLAVEQETAVLKPGDVPATWPSQAPISFRGYTTRYALDLGPVLNGIDIEIRSGERVAIVGRTGAGKSTLALALIRGLEAESGQIFIDGVDIASIELERLRSVVTVVPQDPTLLNGTLRENLDPLHCYSDDQILAAVRQVRLTESLASPLLDTPANILSLGQRQLLCIARALLRQSRVLVLDEATASVDHETDALIQAGLRSCTPESTTVLTIAHRLHTIIDYDRVILLDAGRVVEHGSVRDLLLRQEPDAFFRRLCEETGDIERIKRAAGVL